MAEGYTVLTSRRQVDGIVTGVVWRRRDTHVVILLKASGWFFCVGNVICWGGVIHKRAFVWASGWRRDTRLWCYQGKWIVVFVWNTIGRYRGIHTLYILIQDTLPLVVQITLYVALSLELESEAVNGRLILKHSRCFFPHNRSNILDVVEQMAPARSGRSRQF